MPINIDIFISSKMKELSDERNMLTSFLPSLNYGDIELHAWVFENDAPASNTSIRPTYLETLQKSTLYIGLFWNEYGEWTIDEFKQATALGIDRHIYVKNIDSNKRDPRLSSFLEEISKVESGITPKWFKTLDDLKTAVKLSIEVWIKQSLAGRRSLNESIVATIPYQIPNRPKTLIGRDNLLHQVQEQLDNGQNVILQGFPGTGKTAIAATIASRHIQEQGGRVLWIKTGLRNTEKLDYQWSMLAERHITLVVLDDVWDGAILRRATEVLTPETQLLVTSRRRYSIGKIMEVGNLEANEAIQLLFYHADKDYANNVKSAELCKTLGYLPFAIEIAGITLKTRRWTPSELLRRINKAPHNLNMPLDFAENGRQSVADLLEVSLDSLEKKVRDIFFAFGGLFAPKATLELLQLYKMRTTVEFGFASADWREMIAQKPNSMSMKDLSLTIQGLQISKLASKIDPIDIDNEINELQDNGLIEWTYFDEAEEGYYHLHELAFSYVQAQASEVDHQKAFDACIAYIDKYRKSNFEDKKALILEIDNFW